MDGGSAIVTDVGGGIGSDELGMTVEDGDGGGDGDDDEGSSGRK